MNHLIEFPTLVKKENNRIWKIFVRLIKKESRQNFQTIDWNLMLETQISIKEEYSDRLPDDIIAQFWVETGKVNGKLSRSIPTYPEEKILAKKIFVIDFLKQFFYVNLNGIKRKRKVLLKLEMISYLIIRFFPCWQILGKNKKQSSTQWLFNTNWMEFDVYVVVIQKEN